MPPDPDFYPSRIGNPDPTTSTKVEGGKILVGIRDPEFGKKPISDPGVKKAPDSGSATLNICKEDKTRRGL
jgi:hypothetical protein